MMRSALYVISALTPVFVLSAKNFDPNTSTHAGSSVITCDVAVIGGGASGTFGAINLQKQGKSVIVIEKEDFLGGHTNTYTDPNTGVVVDYGVQTFWDIPATRDYFDYLNLTTGPYSGITLTGYHADFQTGKPVTGVHQSTNLTTYEAQLNKYPYLGYGWSLPKPIPSDLLLPFGDFVAKYNLQDVAYSIFMDGEGAANPPLLEQLTVNVLKLIDDSFFDTNAGASINPTNGNGDIYAKAGARLGKNVLLSSTVSSAQRPSGNGSIELVVQTPSGTKLVRASKLLVSIPPLLDNMQPFDLDSAESDLFSQWTYSNYFVMLVNNTGLPANYHFSNANSSAATYNIPQLPAPYQITATKITDLFFVWYGSPKDLSQAQVKEDVGNVIERLRLTVNSTLDLPVQFVEFRSHTPFKLVVSADAIERGFYDQLYGLQGHRNTYYTGAAFLSHDASELFNFTQAVVLPKVLD
ncbi:hypothetical protein MBLNU459_g0804t1 [Dothideomycetes sp. NU459]